jgi:hypothetical protein
MGLKRSGVRSANSGVMYHPASQLWINIKRHTIIHSTSFVNPWDMMSKTTGHSSGCKTIPTMHFRYKKNRRVVIMETLRETDTKEVHEEDMDVVMDEDMEEGEVDTPLVSITNKFFMYQFFSLNFACFVHIFTVPSMS